MAEENEIDLENPAIKAAIATAVEASVSGLKTKNSELLGKLKETSGKLTQFETQFEGIDIDAVKGLLSRAGQDEETKLLTEGKVDEVFNRRTERLRGDYDKQLKAISERAEKAESFAQVPGQSPGRLGARRSTEGRRSTRSNRRHHPSRQRRVHP